MPASRYDDPCGIARALDVVGDRWALLVVRELIFGGKRFAQLRAGLPGVSPNVLSQRLRELEASGLVRRQTLPPPVNVTVYELTERGAALEPVLLELGRWGSRQPLHTAKDLSVSAFLVALKTVFHPAAATSAVIGLLVGGESFRLTVSGTAIDIRRDDPSRADGLDRADVTLAGDLGTVRSVAFGRETPAAAERAGRLQITGNRRLAAQFGRMFPVPRPD